MGGFDATMWQRVRAGSTARGAGLACWWRGPSGAFGGAAFAGAALRRGESQPVGNAVGGKAGRCTVGKRQEPPRDRPTDGARAEKSAGLEAPCDVGCGRSAEMSDIEAAEKKERERQEWERER